MGDMVSASFWKRCVVFTVGSVMLLGLLRFAPAAAAQSFPDVAANSFHYGAIEYLKAKGVVSGYPDGTFRANTTINRAEALKMVMIAAGLTTAEATAETSGTEAEQQRFPDVHTSDWFYHYVLKAVDLAIVEGYEDGLFKPANNINVAESLKIIFLSFKVDTGVAPSQKIYPDVQIDDWYATYANYAREKQFIWPADDGRLNAGRDISRGDFAQIIYRLMFTQEHSLTKFPLSVDWPEYEHPAEHYKLKYPFTWKRMLAGNDLILWKDDTANGQLSWYRVFPNSATIVISVDDNKAKLSLEDYVNRLIYSNDPLKQILTLNSYPFASVAVKATLTTDYFFELPNGEILVAYSQLGGGQNSPYLGEEIRNVIGSIRFDESAEGKIDLDAEAFLANVRKSILVEGGGQKALDLFSDLVLIETDSIGIGTGPVDYFYSAAFETTLKYERTSDTLLAMNKGNSTAF